LKLSLPRFPLTRMDAVARRIDTRSRRESRDLPRQCEDDIKLFDYRITSHQLYGLSTIK
jgi:hypothetical protein